MHDPACWLLRRMWQGCLVCAWVRPPPLPSTPGARDRLCMREEGEGGRGIRVGERRALCAGTVCWKSATPVGLVTWGRGRGGGADVGPPLPGHSARQARRHVRGAPGFVAAPSPSPPPSLPLAFFRPAPLSPQPPSSCQQLKPHAAHGVRLPVDQSSSRPLPGSRLCPARAQTAAEPHGGVSAAHSLRS